MIVIGHIQIKECSHIHAPIFFMESCEQGDTLVITTVGKMALQLNGQTTNLIIYSADYDCRFIFKARCKANLTNLLKNQVVIEVLSFES